jgi:integrase
MRRWKERRLIANHFVEWNGVAVSSVKNGFARAVKVAELSTIEGNVTPHTLRHTAVTWLMQRGADPWQAAGFLGMSVKVLLDTYGHHHPDYMKEAAKAITRQDRKENIPIVETVTDLNQHRLKKQEIQ